MKECGVSKRVIIRPSGEMVDDPAELLPAVKRALKVIKKNGKQC
jgi:hypothetical protein